MKSSQVFLIISQIATLILLVLQELDKSKNKTTNSTKPKDDFGDAHPDSL